MTLPIEDWNISLGIFYITGLNMMTLLNGGDKKYERTIRIPFCLGNSYFVQDLEGKKTRIEDEDNDKIEGEERMFWRKVVTLPIEDRNKK